MVMPFLILYDISVDCFFRTPLKAGIAGLTMMLPYRPFVNHFNVTYRTYSRANTAAITFFFALEVPIHQGNEFLKESVR
jgi:hypothetical protein